LNPWLLDGVLAAVLTAVAFPSAFHANGSMLSPAWLAVPLAALQAVPLVVRRRWPVAVFAVTLGAAIGIDLITGNAFFFGVVVAVYTLAAHGRRPLVFQALAIGAAAAAALVVYDRAWDSAVIPLLGITVVAWVVGDNLRTRRAYLRAVEERALRLEHERVQQLQRAAAEEQARIARELHDVIAHSVSVMVVQAAAARDVFDARPERAREALGSIERAGREALSQLRSLLGVVRAPDEAARPYQPQPGLADVDELVERVRRTGLPVELVVEGERVPVPVGIDLSAYRIVQEALTNTLKHAHATSAGVAVRYGPGEVTVEVVDDGAGAGVEANGGHGLIGMRERVALYGGELRAGARPHGGFAVSARFPLDDEGAI
jgi:signal transduction histidine kinase